MSRRKSYYGGFNSFTLEGLPNKNLWLDFGDATTLNGGTIIDLDSINSVDDKSGQNNNATEVAITRQPIYHNTDGGYGQFDGLNDRLINLTKVSTTQASFHIVLNMQDFTTYNHVFADTRSLNGLLFSGRNGNSFSVISNGSSLKGVPGARTINTKYLLSFSWNTIDDGIDIYVNGVFLITHTFSNIALGTNGYIIGEWFNGTGDAEMKLYEIVRTSIESSNQDFTDTMAFLINKHSI